MKTTPILFSTPMVRSILNDSKTQTRRTKNLKLVNEDINKWEFISLGSNPNDDNDEGLYAYFKIKNTDTWTYIKCPCKVGDVFWVRETTAKMFEIHEELVGKDNEDMGYWYRTDGELSDAPFYIEGDKWKPSIFMPKEACRIFLEVTNIRIEKLQDISEEDAIAEGIICITAHNDPERIIAYNDYMVNPKDGFDSLFSAKHSFESLWESINGKESLDENPYVFVYDFKRVDKPKNFI